MFKDIRNVTKHSSIYLLGNFISKIIGVILLPLYTKLILVEAYGIYAVFEVTIQFAVGILHLGLPNALFRWLSLEKYKKRWGGILFTTFSALLLVSLGVLFFAFSAQNVLSDFIFNNTVYAHFFPVVAIIIGLRLLNRIPLTLIRFEEKSLLFITITIARFLLQLLSTIYFVAFMKLGIIGIFYGQLIGEITAFIGLMGYLIKKFKFEFEFKILKEMISFGFPLTFSGFSSRILNMGDRYILGYLTNMSIVGVYSLGYKFANLIDTLIVRSFRTAFIPLAWKKLKEENAKRFYSKLLTYYTFIVFWIALFISVYAKGIIHTFALRKSYWDAYKIVAIVVFAIGIKGSFSILKMGLQFTKKTKYIAYIVLSAAIINIALNFVLIPYLQMYGAALATLISFLFIAVVGYKTSHKFYPIQFEWYRLGKIGLVTFLIYSISHIFNPLPTLWRIITKFIFLGTYPVLLYFISFYDSKELYRIKGAIKKWTDIKKIIKNIKNIKF
ncbi:MAG: oligosaccharide flippase family protein [Candidatus Cloacimonetes bacterium]|nr:oligosaccharide flippase family protein [Candidatus Cloacimonadota bacterium]MBS3768465.1 oligosaccharide flippase family protein [Candidatus Cloacimonadota bacterium]